MRYWTAGCRCIDDFGQYIHAEWPGKATSFEQLKRDWAQENRMLVP